MAIPITQLATPSGILTTMWQVAPIIFEDIALTKKAFKTSPLGAEVNIEASIVQFSGLLNLIPSLSQFTFFYGLSQNPNPISQWGTVKFPYANRQIASNSAVKQPTQIGLTIQNEMEGVGGLSLAIAKMQGLRVVLDNYQASGGTFTILTPSQLYKGCVYVNLQDDNPQQAGQTFSIVFENILTTLSNSFTNNINPQLKRLSNGGVL